MIRGLKNIQKNALRKWIKVVQASRIRNYLKMLDLVNYKTRNSMKEAHERVKGVIFTSPESEQLLREWKVFLSVKLRKPSIDEKIYASSKQQRTLRRK